MTRVPDWSEQEFEDRSVTLAGLIRRAWRAVARLIAGQLESKPIVTAADAGGIPAAWDVEAEAQVLGYLTDTYLDAAGKVREAVDAPDDFLLTDDLVTAYLKTARNRLRHIGDEVWQEVSAQLIQGVSAGESIPELAMRVKSTAGVSDARSLTIARTEVHAAHEAGSYDQALFVDPDATKVWLATEDVRTRETHRIADGQRRKLNEPFEVGGGQLRYPGDPLGPADEVINCRCTTVYDFGTLDSVTSDEPELALVAASKKKWTPSKHPRGSDGKFIKKGAVADLLSKPKPELLTVSTAIDELSEKSWGQLTDAQQDYIMDSYGKLPKGSFLEKHATEKLSKIGALKSQPAADKPEKAPATPKAKVLAQGAPKTNKAALTIAETDDFAQLGNQKYKKPLGKTGKPLRVGFLGDDGSITAHVGSKPGDPAKVSTFLIWGKYPPGTTILESADGKDSVVWNGKKFDFRTDGQTTKTLGKQDTYDTLHSQTGWVVPKYEGQPVDQPGVLTELVEGYVEPDDEVDTDFTPATPDVTPEVSEAEVPATPVNIPETDGSVAEAVDEIAEMPEPEPEPELEMPDPGPASKDPFGPPPDVNALKDTGITVGSHGARIYEDESGQRWLFKKQDQFATDLDIGASKLQALAGRPYSDTFAVTMPNGKSGSIQKMLPGKSAFPKPYQFKATDLSEQEIGELLGEHPLDWLIGNYDAHSENYIQLPDGQTIGGVDKGNSLKFFGQDALDWDWRPNEHRTVYSELWRAFAGGKDVDITPANLEKMKAAVARLQQIPDETIKELFRPYAEGVHAKGWLATAKSNSWAEKLKPRTVPPQNVEAFLDAIVARKHSLDKDFEEFHTKALNARAKALGVSVESLQSTPVLQTPDAVPQAPEVSAPDVLDEPDILQQLLDGTYQDPVSESLASLKTNGYISNADAVQVAIAITQDEWNGLTADQRSKIALGVDDALDMADLDNSEVWLAFNKISDLQSKQTAPAPSPSPAMTIPTPASQPAADVPAPAALADLDVEDDADTLTDSSAWLDLIDENANVDTPTILAESGNGKYRVIAHPDNTLTVEWNTNGSWLDMESYDPGLSSPDSLYETVESYASGWHKVDPTPVAPTVAPSAPSTTFTTPTLTLPDGSWTLSTNKSKSEIEAYTSFAHPAGTILGITPDVKMQAVSAEDGSYILQMTDADGNWFDGAAVSAGTLATMLNENTWTLPNETFDTTVTPASPSVPAWKLVPAIDPPEGTVYEPVQGYLGVLDDYVNFDHPAGTVIALRNVNGVNVRIVKTGLDSPEYKTQIQSLSDQQWYDNNAGDVSAALVINQLQTNDWLLPQSALLPALGPKTTPVGGPSVPNVTPSPAPAASGADTSTIPTFYKKSWKKKLSAAKVGYYSKPEKIWDQVKQIQAQYPDPANPGQSKYTPLQIIKSLDDVYTGKKEQSPYETKMVKWAATSKGKAYTGNTGTTQASTPNTPAATQTAPPPDPQPMAWTTENTEKLFDAVQDLDLGTVLATNVDLKGIQYQIVVADQAGVKTPHMIYLPVGASTWQDSVFMPTKVGFVSAVNIDFGNGPWKAAVVQLPNGGIAPATTPVVPGSTIKPTLAPTFANADLVWNKLGGLPDGTVVAYNPGGKSHEYQMIVKAINSVSSQVVWQQKAKDGTDEDWVDVPLSASTSEQFTGFVTDNVGGNPWQLFDVGVQGGTPAGTPTTPVPKPFKATVKAIYAAMPTYTLGKPLATAEVNGEKYALVPGYGYTKSYKKSTKKKLILKKQMPSGAWAVVEPLDTQVKLGAVLKDPKYAWIEAAPTPAVPPPSVATPVKASKPTVSVGVFAKTPEDVGNLWDSLNEIGDGMIIADGTPNGVPTKIMSKIDPDGSVKAVAHTETGSTVIASNKQELVNLLVGDETWTVTASKSPLFGAGEISGLSEAQQQSLYADFKKQPATYLKSPAQDIYAAMSSIASDNGLTLLQMLRVVDAVGAKKVNQPDQHLFEKKIKDWLQTPQGAAVASGKPIPLPEGPAMSPGVSLSGMPSFEDSNQYTYKTISTTEATKLGNEFKSKSQAGAWTQDQHDGLQAYTGGIYYSINQYYYGKIPSISSTNEKAAKGAQLGMRPSTVPLLLHRGTGFDGVGGANGHNDLLKMVGSTFFSGGFFSTSVGGKAAFGGKPVLLEIEAPPGTPMAYLKNISLHKSENEMLLAAGLSYRIMEVRKEGSKSVVRVRVVPPDKPFPWETSVEA